MICIHFKKAKSCVRDTKIVDADKEKNTSSFCQQENIDVC
jgi:hypothetical protein